MVPEAPFGLEMCSCRCRFRVRGAQWLIGLISCLIVFGHNLLSPISFNPGETGHTLWAILHGRGVIFDGAFRIKASYPVLPWIGVILLGNFADPLCACTVDKRTRRTGLIGLGVSLLALLLVLRGFNIYGEVLHWHTQGSALVTVMDFINYTKYPPSLHFVLLTIGSALLLLALFEALSNKFTDALEVFGSAPMFVYIVHLYVLLISYRIVLATVGPNAGDVGVLGLCWMWQYVPFERQRRPVVGVLGLRWLLQGSFDCVCCPHTSVLRPSVACLAVFPCA